MQKLVIKNFGPIKECNIEIKDFMVLTGPQASGKSTAAKCVFFFNHLGGVLTDLAIKDIVLNKNNPIFHVFYNRQYKNNYDDRQYYQNEMSRRIRDLLIQSFGLEYDISDIPYEGKLYFEYENGNTIKVSIIQGQETIDIQVNYSDGMIQGFQQLYDMVIQIREQNPYSLSSEDKQNLIKYVENEIFGFEGDVVYITAGRSLLTLLSSQINYIYSIMDDQQKGTIDYCTRCYLEEVMRIEGFFSSNLKTILRQSEDASDYKFDPVSLSQGAADFAVKRKAVEIIRLILKGEYRNVNGEERLYYDDNKFVKMNYASSGQQEAVWITNILLYHMLRDKKSLFIIEEPESHLFPETQKMMVDLISLVKNGRNKVIITTHSPYILGSVNNLMYANRISDIVDQTELDKMVSRSTWLDFDDVSAYYLDKGNYRDIRDPEYEDIDNVVIDEASSEINHTYDAMVALKEMSRKR